MNKPRRKWELQEYTVLAYVCFENFPSFLKTKSNKPSDQRNNFRMTKDLSFKRLNRFRISDYISLFILCFENKVMIPHIWILGNYKDQCMEVNQLVSNIGGYSI